MQPDDNVCLCFRVPLRKVRSFLRQEDPEVASLLSECMGAGTGCQWCVPFLKELHRQHAEGDCMGTDEKGRPAPDLRISPQRYAEARKDYNKTGERPELSDDEQG
jgi:bacterioferritin-associated ferredoxin